MLRTTRKYSQAITFIFGNSRSRLLDMMSSSSTYLLLSFILMKRVMPEDAGGTLTLASRFSSVSG